MSDETQEPNPLSRRYRGHTIELRPADLKFHVEGPEFEQYRDTSKTFSSFDEARAKIDREVEAGLKLRAKNLKFREIVIDENGERQTITAIHRGTGDIMGLKGQYVYPDADWIPGLLKRRSAIQKELVQIGDALQPIRISVSQAYGRVETDRYASKITELADEINQKREQATKNPPATIIDLKTQIGA